jgi:hypothetical protein
VETLTTGVADAVTRFLIDGASKLGTHVGAVAADAARTLARLVLDRLGGDPAQAATVERYRAEPEAMQPEIETALAVVVEADRAFAAELLAVLRDYDPNSAPTAIDLQNDRGHPVSSTTSSA